LHENGVAKRKAAGFSQGGALAQVYSFVLQRTDGIAKANNLRGAEYGLGLVTEKVVLTNQAGRS
jgi:hypothetical protein